MFFVPKGFAAKGASKSCAAILSIVESEGLPELIGDRDPIVRSENLVKFLSKKRVTAKDLVRSLFVANRILITGSNEKVTLANYVQASEADSGGVQIRVPRKRPRVDYYMNDLPVYDDYIFEQITDKTRIISIKNRSIGEFSWSEYDNDVKRKLFRMRRDAYVTLMLEDRSEGIEWGSIEGRKYSVTTQIFIGLNRDFKPTFLGYMRSDTILRGDGDSGLRSASLVTLKAD